ncbi:hypothetical protein UFOVP816_19 [uncultured Caudovirales phage]|uniref:Uncharacterized protein n=1 Tax=uncultured Caudovirales phage TaxID=2100421 RepID=A0A6J5P5D5_9CAUD|nr:hypothetical protein UFOVP816_19 [uncultured Caudovirales phage]
MTYQVTANINGREVTETFTNKMTASLWKAYKEHLAHEMKQFDVPANELMLLGDAIEMKVEMLKKENKGIKDIEYLHHDFGMFYEMPIKAVTYEMLLEQAKVMAQTKVRQGGCKFNETTGTWRTQSPATILRKFRALASVYSHVIEQGINIDNPALRMSQYLQAQLKNQEK